MWHFLNGVPVIPVLRTGTNLAGDGSASAPSYSFASDPDTGFHRNSGANIIGVAAGGANVALISATGVFANGLVLDLANQDVVLSRGAANRLDLASGDSFFITAGGLGVGTTETTSGRITALDLVIPLGVLAFGPTSGIGYTTGAGGAVTQITSKATGVTLSKVTGQITMHNATLNAAAEVSFVLTNTVIAATDVIIVNHGSAGTAGAYLVGVAAVAAGSCTITVANLSASNLGEAIVLNFAVIKGVAA